MQTALQGLVAYVNSVPSGPSGTTATTTMSMSINDGAADTVTSVSTIDIVSGGSIVAGGITILGATAGQMTSDQTPIEPAAVDIEDSNVGVTDTVTVTMSNPANGTFSDALGGTVNGGTFTVSGIPNTATFGLVENVNSVLAALVFTPTRGQVAAGQSVTTLFTIVANDGPHSATDASASVIATDEGGQFSISGAQANQELTGGIVLQPLSGVTVADSTPSAVDTATVTLSNPAAGTLGATNGGTVGSNGVFRITGALAAVQAALQALTFTPAPVPGGQVQSTGAMISVVDGTLSATNTTTSLDVIGTGAAGTIVPNRAVAGLSSSGPALTAGSAANNFVLNLGTVSPGAVVTPVTLDALNTATAPADTLDGTFVVNDIGGFVNSGFAGFDTLAAGSSLAAGSVTLTTTQAGTFNETITLIPMDVSGTTASQIQPDQTVTVEAVVAAPVPASAVEVLVSAGTIQLPNARVGGLDQRAISISNGATAPADTLSVAPVAAGQATVSGTIAGLAAGGIDATDILAGVDTSSAGLRQGTVTLAASSVNAGGTAVPLANPPQVTVSANVFRLASGTVSLASPILHVGDSGVLPLVVGNIAANDGYSEALIAAIGATTGAVGAASSGPSADIAPSGTNASALAIVVPTNTAAVDNGSATVDLTSDGGIGAGSIDGLGTTALTPQTIAVAVTVDNYANPVFEDVSNPGAITGGGTAYTLNLGTVTQGDAPLTVNLGVYNDVAGPSDVVSGSLAAVGSSAFTNSGLVAFGSLAAGQADVAPTITLATGTTGTFSETITLSPTGSNAGGYAAALANETLTVTGSVAASTGTVSPITPAVAAVLSANPLNFGAVHVGAAAQQSLDISNTAPAPAAGLDASVTSVSGAATASGSFTDLAAGTTIPAASSPASTPARPGARPGASRWRSPRTAGRPAARACRVRPSRCRARCTARRRRRCCR